MNYANEGAGIREMSKKLVLDFMRNSPECFPHREGLRQAEIFRECGFDWGDFPNAESSKQQFWIVGLLRELEKEGKIQRNLDTKYWRLTEK